MVESPCVKVCKLDTNGVCVGCFRSAEEIGRWFKADEAEREQIVRNAQLRLKSIKRGRWW